MRLPEQPDSGELVESKEVKTEAQHHPTEVSSEMAKRSQRIADLQRRTKAELYEYARERGIEHRSQMSKSELVAALVDVCKS